MSIKGPNGGYRLARSPSDITVLEIVEAVDGPIRGQAPPPEREDEKRFPHYKPETTELLYNKLENLCKSSTEHLRKSFEKVKMSELIKK